MSEGQAHPPSPHAAGTSATLKGSSPFLRAPEGARSVFLITLFAACGPLAGGILLFGWRAAVVAGLAMTSCVVIELLYYRVTRVPALLGRSHAALTGLLLALTFPAFVPWYVPVVASAFAIIVGKAVFGGVGHFVWQPALVGRLAVAVMFPFSLGVASEKFVDPPRPQPILARSKLLIGDIRSSVRGDDTADWGKAPPPKDADAVLVIPPTDTLSGLTDRKRPAFSALVFRGRFRPGGRPAALLETPPIGNLFYGVRPGGIGETMPILLVVALLYLMYRNFLKWQLAMAFFAATWATVAICPIYFAEAPDSVRTLWFPVLTEEGFGVAITYINCQLLGGGLLLSILLVSAEMTSRPVTTGGQIVFAVGCGALAMVLQLYADMPIPCYMAVLAMNTLTPTIDRLWRPRVFGTRRLAMLRGRR